MTPDEFQAELDANGGEWPSSDMTWVRVSSTNRQLPSWVLLEDDDAEDQPQITIEAAEFPDGWYWAAHLKIEPPDPGWSSAEASSQHAPSPRVAMEEMMRNVEWLNAVSET